MNTKEYINAYVMPDITVEEIEIETAILGASDYTPNVTSLGEDADEYDGDFD